jgi:predicted ATPase/DNA-binding CsgD family transcriptional regulator
MTTLSLGGSSVVDVPALTIPLTPLIGREAELAEASARLARPEVRLLSLTGPGGVGKTRLALALSTRVADQFPDGVVFVPWAAVSDPDLVFHVVAQALAMSESPRQSILEQLIRVLQGRRALLFLDNFEQVRSVAPDLSTLLAACPDLKLLVTSRVALRLQSEHEFLVPPMAVVPASDDGSPHVLAQLDAVQLFVQRARAVRHDFQLTEANLPVVVEICRQVDGLPLAIELAATRIRLLSPQLLLPRLANRLGLLTGGPHDLPSRQQTLRATIAWSYNLLEPSERVLLQRLAVFAGGWTLEAAEAVAGSDLGIDTLEGLAVLVDHHLVQSVEQPNGALRFVMLETIREYALEQLSISGEEPAIRKRHMEYYLHRAYQVESIIRGPRALEALEAMDGERDNFRAALSWTLEQEDPEHAQALSGALQWYWWARNDFREGRDWLARALAKGNGSPSVYGWALVGAGAMVLRLGAAKQSTSWLNAGIAVFRDIGDVRGAGYGLFHLANVYSVGGELVAAAPLYTEALDCFERVDDHWGISLALSYLGYTLYELGQLGEGLRRMEQAVAIARQLGAEPRLAGALVQLGILAQSRNEHDRALEYFREAFTLEWTRKVPTYLSRYLIHLGAILVALERLEPAVRLFGAAAAVAAASGYTIYAERLKEYQTTLDRVERTLGEEAFARAWVEGAALNRSELKELADAELQEAVDHLREPQRSRPVGTGIVFDLTPRELEILRLLATGRSSQEIADDLYISAHTVKRHIANILGKLEVSSRAAAVALAFQHDLV